MASDPVESLIHLFHKRYDVLHCLCDDRLDKQTVEERTGASRPTVDRAFRELEAAGILSSTGTAYELTSFGDLCCTEFERIDERLRTLTAAEGLLSHLPRDAGFDMDLLDGAEIHYAEDHAPHEPLVEVVDVAAAATEFAGYSSIITPHYVDAFHSLIVEQGVPARLVFTEGVVEIGMDNYADRFGAMVDADHTAIYATDHAYTYGAIVGDGRAAIPVGDDRDRLLAVVVNDTPAAAEWVETFLDDLVASDRTREL